MGGERRPWSKIFRNVCCRLQRILRMLQRSWNLEDCLHQVIYFYFLLIFLFKKKRSCTFWWRSWWAKRQGLNSTLLAMYLCINCRPFEKFFSNFVFTRYCTHYRLVDDSMKKIFPVEIHKKENLLFLYKLQRLPDTCILDPSHTHILLNLFKYIIKRPYIFLQSMGHEMPWRRPL